VPRSRGTREHASGGVRLLLVRRRRSSPAPFVEKSRQAD
jgi:hypothetical protein